MASASTFPSATRGSATGLATTGQRWRRCAATLSVARAAGRRARRPVWRCRMSFPRVSLYPYAEAPMLIEPLTGAVRAAQVAGWHQDGEHDIARPSSLPGLPPAEDASPGLLALRPGCGDPEGPALG